MTTLDILLCAILCGLDVGVLITCRIKSNACELFYWTTMLYAVIFIPACSWYYSAINVYVMVQLLLMTYVSLLIAAKRVVQPSMIPHLHFALTILLILFTCIAFGASYTWHFFPPCEFLTFFVKVVDWDDYAAKMSQFAVVGFRDFFDNIENLSIYDVRVFQKFIGALITMGVIPWTLNSLGQAATYNSKKRKKMKTVSS